jgi:nucleoid-associated protein YgaU
MTMFGKLRLLVWTGALAGAAIALVHGASLPDGSGDPAVATMQAVRLVAAGLAAYLFVATVLAVRLPRLAPRFARRLVATIAGTTLLLTPIAAAAATSSAPPPGVEAPVLHRIDEPSSTTAAPELLTPIRPVSDARGAKSEMVVVQPGDHLWAIAERALTDQLGRAVSDQEIVPFWTRLIDANRDRVADPDVIFAGQELRLPS